MKKIYFGALLLLAATTFQSCSDIELPDAANNGLQTVSDLSYQVSERSLTLSWSLPAGNVTKVLVYRDATLIAELDGAATSYFIERAPVNQDNTYTVKVQMGDALVSLGQSVYVHIDYTAPENPNPDKERLAAFLLTANSIEELQDDDDQAAALWFADNYVANEKGVFVKMDELGNLSPEEISCLWIQCDKEGLAHGWANLPYGLADAGNVAALKAFMQDGGNLLLTNHATQLTAAIGRTPEHIIPNIFGAGAGGEGGDNWAMNAQIGLCNPDMFYDHRTHPIYDGLHTLPDYGHETFAMIGPGWREDHNCMWDCNAYGFSGQPNTIVNFEDATNSLVLATWAHVQDYCCAGIVEFNANSEFDGRCIAIGLAAYEFHQNSGTNIFQSNIEQLTKNCIEYLK